MLIIFTINSCPIDTIIDALLALTTNSIIILLGVETDPFYESQESHNLIGVANMYMDVLFCDVKLNYFVPIISQQGEVAGKLQVLSCHHIVIANAEAIS